MAITNASNFGSGQTMKWAGADTDPYDRATQLAAVGQNLDEHTHASGLALPVARISGTCTIPDSATDHSYVFAVSNLAANRTITLPLLTGNDVFVFADFIQTLTNKTLTSPTITSPTISGTINLPSPVLTTPQINDTSSDHQYVFAVSELAADRTVTLPLLGASDVFVFEAFAQTLTNKTITSPSIGGTVAGGATYTTPVLTTPTINGVIRAVRTEIGANYTVTATDEVVLCNSAAITIALPAVASAGKQEVTIKNIHATGVVTIDPNGSETVDGQTTHLIATQYDSITLISSGSGGNWFIK